MDYISALMMRFNAGRSDRKRDAGLTTPANITRHDNIQYGKHPRWNALDEYYPAGTREALPVIVSFHGGGYVYGTKEVYQYYCMSLAQMGFVVVNFNYRLAPAAKFPQPLQECNQVMEWICENAPLYHMDLNNVFLVGDSAGGQMTSQYALIWSNPEYAVRMGIRPPKFRLAAVGLNCGMYDLMTRATTGTGVVTNYFGSQPLKDYGEMLDVLGRIDSRYPPAYVMSAANDFLRPACQPMAQLLQNRGVPVEWKVYGEESDPNACHVFHCNIRLPLAQQCNRDEIAFFRRHIR
ncbi:MAG: alpha/beta hydrolase [Faecalibacterium sp.]|nr:alpha/beta hydrolase [Faecalibacterium sp.]